ncbi:MAG: hypothetical protein HY908_35770 [Myxococcales bacterium]|nr:hypothetical protein [Myxococcales bacterium]
MERRRRLAQLPPDPPGRAEDAPDSELWVVPAAVLCAFCGQPDCAGCHAEETRSGFVAIVPWERPGKLWSRLWSTAGSATRSADTFFGALPDGPIAAALRFALLAELLAITSVALFLLPLFALALPSVAFDLLADPGHRAAVLRGVCLGIPLLSLWMVGAHVLHGVALDAGARRLGGRRQRRRALRFGLYACGWDLMTGPLGALGTLFGRGLRALAEIAVLSMRVPGQASLAFLQGVYGLRKETAQRARRAGTAAALGLTFVSALVALFAALMLLF